MLNHMVGAMAGFDWVALLETNRIHYVTSGPNVGRDHVGVKCPFCPDDPSEHMSISTDNKGWRCWRNNEHRGKSPVKLIMGLLRCSQAAAQQIAGHSVFVPEGDLLTMVQKQFEPDKITKPKGLELPKEFKKFTNLPSGRPYVNYLMSKERGFYWSEIGQFTDKWDMRYCTHGPYYGRIIFPVYQYGKLVTWSGRSIHANAFLRYKTLPIEPDHEHEIVAQCSIRETLLWYDRLMSSTAHTIFICEGPFDALKINVLGEEEGIVSTCLYTNNPSEAQIELLHDLLPRYERRYLLLDRNELANTIKTADRLSDLSVEMAQLSPGVKDPGLLSSLGQIVLD